MIIKTELVRRIGMDVAIFIFMMKILDNHILKSLWVSKIKKTTFIRYSPLKTAKLQSQLFQGFVLIKKQA